MCGVKDVLFMDEEDGFLRPTPEIRKRVCREIRPDSSPTDNLQQS